MALKKLKMEKHVWLPDPVKRDGGQEEQQWSNNPFYKTNLWKKTSAAYRMHNPLCEECLRHGRTVPAKVTDHIKPINPVDAYDTQGGRYGDPLDWNNLQALCRKCHGSKSGKEAHTRP